MMNEPQNGEIGPLAPAPLGLPLAQAIGARNLLIVIVTMPLVFLIVVMATLSVFGRPGEKEGALVAAARPDASAAAAILEQPPFEEGARANAATPAAQVAPASAPLLIPRGAAVGAMALDGDRLALRIDTPAGGEIVVYDVARGAEISRILIKEAGGGAAQEDL